MYLIQTTPPYAEPVHLDDAKTFLRAPSGTADDVSISGMISAAREHCETVTRRQLVVAT